MVQSPVQPAMLRTKLREQLGAVRRVHHFGMELHAVEAARVSSAIAAKGAPVEMPTARKPGGSAVTRSPWLIHTGARSPASPRRRRRAASRRSPDSRRGRIRGGGRPRPCRRAAAHHGLLAIADAEDRHAERRRSPAGACGVPVSCTQAGPPERMIALGANRPSAASALLKGTISRIDAGLAHAPRDELRHLAAEIDDEDAVLVGRAFRPSWPVVIAASSSRQ